MIQTNRHTPHHHRITTTPTQTQTKTITNGQSIVSIHHKTNHVYTTKLLSSSLASNNKRNTQTKKSTNQHIHKYSSINKYIDSIASSRHLSKSSTQNTIITKIKSKIPITTHSSEPCCCCVQQ
eukprot:c20644_g1_i7.p1 GENE.c20644_g1_i7~~c20644_g1_i7.p1  ORF type:complete len:123 (-),score=25.95 c20644_g1_i7:133-501(-)